MPIQTCISGICSFHMLVNLICSELGKIEGRRRSGQPEVEMVEWHHRLDGHEFEQVLGVGGGQGRLACCSPWGCKGLDTTEWLN